MYKHKLVDFVIQVMAQPFVFVVSIFDIKKCSKVDTVAVVSVDLIYIKMLFICVFC